MFVYFLSESIAYNEGNLYLFEKGEFWISFSNIEDDKNRTKA